MALDMSGTNYIYEKSARKYGEGPVKGICILIL
jgi:hypothetical protein